MLRGFPALNAGLCEQHLHLIGKVFTADQIGSKAD